MIEAVHVLDRQAGGIQMGVVRQENERTQTFFRINSSSIFGRGVLFLAAKTGTPFHFFLLKVVWGAIFCPFHFWHDSTLL